MKTIKKCQSCGGTKFCRNVETYYTSGSALGRAPGARGKDEYSTFLYCVICSGTEIEKVLEPCVICGSEAPAVAVDICNRNYDITGMYDYAPGMSNSVNVCLGCNSALDKKIESLMVEAFEAGGFE